MPSSTAPLKATLRALVTAGPTREWLDPVRFISNLSSGRMGYAVAEALAVAGVETTLISGPTALDTPGGVTRIDVESAEEMLSAAQECLPVDIAVCVAAVADFRPIEQAAHKIKKQPDQETLTLTLEKTSDILASLSTHSAQRPQRVVGFALESKDVDNRAMAKRQAKHCDWIFATSTDKLGELSNDQIALIQIDDNGAMPWPVLAKSDAAKRIVDLVLQSLEKTERKQA